MHALAAEGRWLGGRPNYGYRLVDTTTIHPHPEQAALGVHPRTLQPDPATGPFVVGIFEMFDAGLGYKAIGRCLEAEGILSPGESTTPPPPLGRGGGRLRRSSHPSSTPATSAARSPAAS